MQRVHLLGIGGAGMAGMAALLQETGAKISGFDREESDTLRRLRKRGIAVETDEDFSSIAAADCCVYSAAIDAGHPLLKFAKRHVPTFSRGEMMGRISQEFESVTAVAGTHGKTTVCGMLTHILLAGGTDPSVLMGGHLPLIGGNGRLGKSKALVCEACEFAGSFLHIKRDIGIILNIDNDHLEYYGSMEQLKNAFTQFLTPCKTAIVCAEDSAALEASQGHPHRLCYGYSQKADCFATQITRLKGYDSFLLHLPRQEPIAISLQIPGRHNVLNALAAATAAWSLGISSSAIQKGLIGFTGVARRFETLYRSPALTVVDDYAHHPTEIQSVMDSAKQMGFSQITAVFQPFTYSRTLALYKEFAEALSAADRVILPPIMGGREPEDKRITSHFIAAPLPQAVVCSDLDQAAELALQGIVPGQLIITMGCGNVYRCAQTICNRLTDDDKIHHF